MVTKYVKLLHIICVGVLSGEQCAKLFQKATRNASANYCIGVNGDIVCNVEEENRAWTSSNKWNDCQAITIEVSNSKLGGDYPISDASWKALIELCVDICKRYNFKLVYDGTKNGSLTRHNMFAATACPGKYLQNRFPELARIVNSRLEEAQKKSIDEIAHEVLQGKWGNGQDRKNRLTQAGYNYAEVQRRVDELVNGNKPNKKSNEEIAREVLQGKWGNGQDRKNRLTKAGYDYKTIQSIVNKLTKR